MHQRPFLPDSQPDSDFEGDKAIRAVEVRAGHFTVRRVTGPADFKPKAPELKTLGFEPETDVLVRAVRAEMCMYELDPDWAMQGSDRNSSCGRPPCSATPPGCASCSANWPPPTRAHP